MSQELNPYQSPLTESAPNFQEPGSDVAALERRVAELEKRVAGSWLLAPNVLRRILAVWVYLLLGYLGVLAIAFAIVAPFFWLMDWLASRPQ